MEAHSSTYQKRNKCCVTMNKKCVSSNLDRISVLPGNVIDNILACLPIQDAVRTSILSKKWKYKWTTVPHFILHSWSVNEQHRSELGSIINYILCCHSGAIKKFAISIDEVKSHYDLNTWMYNLSPSSIQDFAVKIWWGKRHKLPQYIFSFQQLRHLKLSNFLFKPPSTFKGFTSLISLGLESIEIEDIVLERFIGSCPLLERLTLAKMSAIDCLNISAPNLKYFLFDGEFNSVRFNTPLLAVLSMNLNYITAKSRVLEQRFKFLDFPPAIERLYLRHQFWRFLAICDILKVQPTTFHHLKTLELDKLCLKEVDEISCLLSLITYSPNLQILSITACTERHANLGPLQEYLEAKAYSNCSFNQLRSVKIISFLGQNPELEFIRFVLANSPLLEKMILIPINDLRFAEEIVVMMKVLGFHKASPNAEIKLHLATRGYHSSDSCGSSDDSD